MSDDATELVNQFLADRERLLRENARLREEVASLQTENAQLRERIDVISVKFKCSWCGENLADHSCEDAAEVAGGRAEGRREANISAAALLVKLASAWDGRGYSVAVGDVLREAAASVRALSAADDGRGPAMCPHGTRLEVACRMADCRTGERRSNVGEGRDGE